tara:strand:- start:550 stop:786 length:237 start_codon:yes stop_codon:yes gene_type:complete
MKKLILAVIVLSVGYFAIAKAEDKTYTPQETLEAFASVPGKVGNHFKQEWISIKEHQANSWAEVKFKLQGLKEKFQSE